MKNVVCGQPYSYSCSWTTTFQQNLDYSPFHTAIPEMCHGVMCPGNCYRVARFCTFIFFFFFVANTDLPSKHLVKKLSDNVRHLYDTRVNPGIYPRTCLHSHRRQPNNVPAIFRIHNLSYTTSLLSSSNPEQVG